MQDCQEQQDGPRIYPNLEYQGPTGLDHRFPSFTAKLPVRDLWTGNIQERHLPTGSSLDLNHQEFPDLKQLDSRAGPTEFLDLNQWRLCCASNLFFQLTCDQRDPHTVWRWSWSCWAGLRAILVHNPD